MGFSAASEGWPRSYFKDSGVRQRVKTVSVRGLNANFSSRQELLHSVHLNASTSVNGPPPIGARSVH